MRNTASALKKLHLSRGVVGNNRICAALGEASYAQTAGCQLHHALWMVLLAHFILAIDMKFAQTLLALALAGAMGSAAATTTYIGPQYLGDLVGQSVIINNTVDGFGTPIVDVYDFDISSYTSETIASSIKIKLQYGTASQPVFDIIDFAISLKDVNGFTYATDNTFDAFGQLELNAILAPSALWSPGFYRFVLTGTTAGTSGGSYLGTLSAAPVPESKSYALLLAGLGLVVMKVGRVRRRLL